MNDFTKYELHTLLWAIFYVRKRTNNCGDTMRALRTKIQHMIEEYCNHESDGLSYTSMPPQYRCKKCGVFY